MPSNSNDNADIEAVAYGDGDSSSPSNTPNNSTFEQYDETHGASSAAAAPPFGLNGLESIEDNEAGPDPPVAMTEAVLNDAKGVNQDDGAATTLSTPVGIENMDDEDIGPAPPAFMSAVMGAEFEESEEAGKSMKFAKSEAGVELIDDDGSPNPSTSNIDQQDRIEKKRAKRAIDSAQASGNEESIIVPTEDDMAEGFESDRNRDNNSRLRRLNQTTLAPIDNAHSSPVDTNHHVDEEERNNNRIVNLDEEEGGLGSNGSHENIEAAAVRPALVQDPSTPVIPDAYPVDDIVLGHAEPLLPWWKQRKAKLSFAAVIVLFVVLAVSLGIPLSRKTPDPTPAEAILIFNTDFPSESPTGKPSNEPSTSAPPSDHSSDAPSSSLVPTTVPSTSPTSTPSSSPSACVDQISRNVQKIDLPITNPIGPSVAVDGKDVVIVARQGYGGSVFIVFYTLANGEWQRKNTFQEDGLGGHSSVALSGRAAFVGFPYANDEAGRVLAYNKDQYGDWGLVEDPFIRDSNETLRQFGRHVDIDGDLACVGDYDQDDRTNLYHREGNKWVQFDVINGGGDCSIAGVTIATRGWNNELVGYQDLQLYRYNQELNEITPNQDTIPTGGISSLDLSHDYVVYWDVDEEDAFMYHREETDQTYTFHQQFNISGRSYNDRLAIDNGILVVRGNNEAHIFSEQFDGEWEETITLEQDHWRYSLSGRSLLATSWEGEVYFYNLEGCSQAMPTQTPSLNPSSSPSSSSSPTDTCFFIRIAITYDQKPNETSWGLLRVVGGSLESVKEHEGSEGDTSHVESICLQEGGYLFGIADFGSSDGICCNNGHGNYNITSNGMLIVEGGEFEQYEETTFSIPFVPSS